jgi:hypothetical protein
MSSFCQQCSIDMFGKDFKELASNKEHYDLCETCGHVLVSATGKCIDPNCRVHGTGTRLYCYWEKEKELWYVSEIKAGDSWVQQWQFPYWVREDSWIHQTYFINKKAMEDCLYKSHGTKVADKDPKQDGGLKPKPVTTWKIETTPNPYQDDSCEPY